MQDAEITIDISPDDICSFEFPSEPNYFSDSLYDAMELMTAGQYKDAEPILRNLTSTCPDHIDAIFHLALVMKHTGRSIEAVALTEYAVNIGRSYLPENFKPGTHKMPWGVLDNRGYLRACHGLGLEYLERKKYHNAIKLFKDILLLNPLDNQGVRELAIKCFFELKAPKSVLEICDQYQEDTLPCILWGRALAWYQLNSLDNAAKSIVFAKNLMPKAGKKLLLKTNPKPKTLNNNTFIHGGNDQAYYYKEDFGKYWEETDGALSFLKQHMTK